MDLKQTIITTVLALPIIILVLLVGTILLVGFTLGYLYAKGEDIYKIIITSIRKKVFGG